MRSEASFFMTKYHLRFDFPDDGYITLKPIDFSLGLAPNDRILSVGLNYSYDLGKVSHFAYGIEDGGKNVIGVHINSFGDQRKPGKNHLNRVLSELKSLDGLIESFEGKSLQDLYKLTPSQNNSQLDPLERIFTHPPRRSVLSVPIAVSLGSFGYAVLLARSTHNIISGSTLVYKRGKAHIDLGGVERYATLSHKNGSALVRYVLVAEPAGEVDNKSALCDMLGDLKSLGKPAPIFFSDELDLATLFKKAKPTAKNECKEDYSWVDGKLLNR